MATKAIQKNGDWILNGSKHFISSHVLPDFSIVFAITGIDQDGDKPRKRVSAFLVDRDTPGFDIRRGPRCVSQRAYHTYVLSFDDCRMGPEQMLGQEGEGLALADKWIKMGRVWVGAGCCGRAERLLGLSLDWAASRKQFGQPIGHFQGTSFKLADMATELQAADLLVMHAARKADQGKMAPADAAMCKLFASEMLHRVADNAVQIYGGMGLMEDFPIERLWRDSVTLSADRCCARLAHDAATEKEPSTPPCAPAHRIRGRRRSGIRCQAVRQWRIWWSNLGCQSKKTIHGGAPLFQTR